MKNGKSVAWMLGMVCVGAVLSGCGKSESTPPSTPPPPAATAPAAPAAEPAKAAETMKAAADTAVKEAAPAVKSAESMLAEKAQALIDNAKTLASASKYEEALKVLADLSNMKLTDVQQKVVDALKEQITKAMASKGAEEAKKAVGGLLK